MVVDMGKVDLRSLYRGFQGRSFPGHVILCRFKLYVPSGVTPMRLFTSPTMPLKAVV